MVCHMGGCSGPKIQLGSVFRNWRKYNKTKRPPLAVNFVLLSLQGLAVVLQGPSPAPGAECPSNMSPELGSIAKVSPISSFWNTFVSLTRQMGKSIVKNVMKGSQNAFPESFQAIAVK